MTLTAMALGRMNLAKQAALVLAGSLLIAVAAQVSVPFFPVPMTLQTLAILFVGFAYGSRLGAATVTAYLLEGAVGAPVFANFANGAAFAGPTAGFLVGFVGVAWIAGLATDRGITSPIKLSFVGILASALLYIPGLAWPMGVAAAMGIEVWGADLAFGPLTQAFVTPFLLGDVVKAVLAALLVSGGLAWLKRRAA
ncbi:MAG: biotin transporter BioY [Pseudomonadota bacterium]